MSKILEFDEWLEQEYDELQIAWAEEGCDRELDCETYREEWEYKKYEKYLKQEN